HMLLLSPKIIALTNIDIDHMDFYKDLRDIQRHFQQFVDKLPADGVLVKNLDDANLSSIVTPRMITYGFTEKATFRASGISLTQGSQTFTVHKERTLYDTFTISLPGVFNVLNALAVIAVADHLGMTSSEIGERLATFRGTWRRLELIGKYNGAPVYSDYGHHPTAIRATLRAIKEFYPKKRCVLVYQPHSYDRTEKLFKKFGTSFDDADVLVLTEIYDVAGRDIVKHV
ncbi:MAG: Mur ligase family protein, partial [Patescibacteria group bacterium]